MKEISVNQAQTGHILAQSVTTSLGGTLYHSGHELNLKDLDVLRAFLIEKITITEKGKGIDSVKNEEHETNVEEVAAGSTFIQQQQSIIHEYGKVVQETARTLADFQMYKQVPVIKIREFLIPFVMKAIETPYFLLQVLQNSGSKEYLAHHAVGVSLYTAALAIQAGIETKEIPQVILAGFLHNIGQTKIDASILNKSVALSQDEFRQVQLHTKYGYDILKKTPGILEGVVLGALQHHEREDGSGYPLGLKGEQIHPYAKMIAICDIFYAMCSERTYKKALSPFLVLEQLKSDSYGKLDPKYVYLFVKLITDHLTVGTKVLLSNGSVAEVVFVDKNTPTRPMVSIDGKIVNLDNEKTIHIDKLL